jgi:hypothetical protein
MIDKIFGYDWEDIQQAQQRGRLRPAIGLAKEVIPVITDADRKLMEQHGTVEALEAAGFFGTADRFRRAP